MLSKLKNLFTRKPKQQDNGQVALAQRVSGGLPSHIGTLTSYCMNKCSSDELICHNLYQQVDPVWLEERRVVHVCEDGSQWSYIAKMGVRTVACPKSSGERLDVLYFTASATCDILKDFRGVDFKFINRPYMMIVREDGSKITMRRPYFSVQAVDLGWQAFTDYIEKEAADKSTLGEFIVEDTVSAD